MHEHTHDGAVGSEVGCGPGREARDHLGILRLPELAEEGFVKAACHVVEVHALEARGGNGLIEVLTGKAGKGGGNSARPKAREVRAPLWGPRRGPLGRGGARGGRGGGSSFLRSGGSSLLGSGSGILSRRLDPGFLELLLRHLEGGHPY